MESTQLTPASTICARRRPVGSCAEYLYNTVAHLEAFGIRDRNPWRLQELAAHEIEALHRGAESGGGS